MGVVRRTSKGWAAELGVVWLVVLAVSGASTGCKKPKKRILTKEQQQLVADAVLAEAPKLSSPVNANLSNKIKLLGVEVEPERPAIGQKATLIYYWECLEPTEGGWKVFVHLEQPGKRQILDHHPVRDFYPIAKWKKGEIVKDEQPFDVDPNFKPGKATLWLGVFDDEAWRTQQASDRLKLVNPNEVPNDGSDRIKALEFEVQAGSGQQASAENPARRPPRYYARPAGGPVTIDGKADEPAWKSAPKTRVFLRPDGRPASSEMMARAQLVYDDTNLYVAFDLSDKDVQSPFSGRDQTLWEADVVELFIDPGQDGASYAELQVSPVNAVFDAIFESHRSPKWQEAAKVDLPLQSAVNVDGTVNQAGDEDKGWTVELAIPFASLPGAGSKPAPGTTWTLNMYRIDQAGPRNMAYQATWAPLGGDFHQLEGAGELIFAEAPPASPAPGGSPLPGGDSPPAGAEGAAPALPGTGEGRVGGPP